MPQGDRTGPQGQGPKTGQGRGGKGAAENRKPAPRSQGGMETGREQRTGRGAGRGQGKGGGAGQGRGKRR